MKKLYTLLSLVLFSFAANAQCSDVFISEYLEGSSNTKALELYNPTMAAIDLTTYQVVTIGNGGSFTNVFQLYGSLASNDVFVIATDQADAAVLALADTALGFPSVCHFNGDDAVLLVKGTDTIDVFGIPRVDPGSSWTWNVGGTDFESRNSTLVRDFNVEGGVTVWDTLQWVSTPIDDFSKLGSHSSACHPPMATEPATAAATPTKDAVDVISIYSQSYTNPAGINYFPFWNQTTQYADFVIGMDSMIKYSSLNYQGIDFDASQIDASSMEMLHIDIWTADVDDIDIFPISRSTGERAVKVALTAGQWNSIDIPVSDYTSQGLSMSDIYQFKFDNLGSSRDVGTIFIDNMYLWKEPTLVYNKATIAEAVVLNADFAPVREDSLHEITGIVYGVDLQGGGAIQFTLIDDTDGIGVFGGTAVDGYVVNQGDEITIKGAISFFNGLTQISPDSIMLLSTGNALKDATVVTQLSEETESDLVALEKVWLVDGTLTEWPTSSTNLDITNGTDTFAMRLDSDIPGVMGKTIDFDTMNITGLGGQFDRDAPYNEGYQLFPRDSADITEWISTKMVTFMVDMSRHKEDNTWNTVNLNGTFNGWCGSCIEMTDEDGDDVYEVTVEIPVGEIEWKFTLDGWDAQEEFEGGESCTKTTDGFTNRVATVEGDLSIPVVCYNYCVTCETVANVSDLAVQQVSVYPNPATTQISVSGNQNWNTYAVYTIHGVKVAEGTLNNNKLDVNALTSGSYILKLASQDNSGVARFVVNK